MHTTRSKGKIDKSVLSEYPATRKANQDRKQTELTKDSGVESGIGEPSNLELTETGNKEETETLTSRKEIDKSEALEKINEGLELEDLEQENEQLIESPEIFKTAKKNFHASIEFSSPDLKNTVGFTSRIPKVKFHEGLEELDEELAKVLTPTGSENSSEADTSEHSRSGIGKRLSTKSRPIIKAYRLTRPRSLNFHLDQVRNNRKMPNDNGNGVNNEGRGNLSGAMKEALRLLPEFNGERESLGRYISGLQEGLEIVGPDLELALLRQAKVKLTGPVWEVVTRNTFNNIAEYVDYLRSTYDPPRDLFQLYGELGSSVQRKSERVSEFAHRIQEKADKILESMLYKNNALTADDKIKVAEMAKSCFLRGLRTEIRQEVGEQANLKDAIKKAKTVANNLEDLELLRERDSDGPKYIDKRDKKAKINVIQPETKVINQNSSGNVTAAPIICQNCGKKGHSIENCWAKLKIKEQVVKIICQLCNKEGHTADKCFARQAAEIGQGLTICQMCGKRGHTIDRCYSMPCKICGRPGHLAENCFRAQRPGNAPAFSQGRSPQGYQAGNNKQNQAPSIQCQACHKWGHTAAVCRSRFQGIQGPLPVFNPQFMPKGPVGMTYSQAVNTGNNYQSDQRGPMVCYYCKLEGHRMSECQLRGSDTRQAEMQGNGNGLQVAGALSDAKGNIHPTMPVTGQ